MRKNALWNCRNPFQGSEKRVLVVCSAGLLRSPTCAWLLSQYNYNTRSCGIHDYALIQFDEVLLEWADIIIFVEDSLYQQCSFDIPISKQLIILDIPDTFSYKDPELLSIIHTQCIEKKLIHEKD